MAPLLEIAWAARRWRPWLWLLPTLLLAAPMAGAPADPTKPPKPARFKISGYGLLGDRELKRILRTVELGGRKPEFFGPDFVEDAALVLTARARNDGYLRPAITIDLTLADGQRLRAEASQLPENPLPRPLRVTAAEFRLRKGRLYYFHDLQFEGMNALSRQQALACFIETGTLFSLRHMRTFTPERLKRGLASLTEELDRLGFRDATVTVPRLDRDDRTGAVVVRVAVNQGPKYLVRSVREQFLYDGAAGPEAGRTQFPGRPFSRLWREDFSLSLKTNLYQRGFPDVTVQLETVQDESAGAEHHVDLLARVRAGPQVRVGAVEFSGEKRTRLGLMSRRVRVQRGEWLNPIRTENGRLRLAGLGTFDKVELSYRPVDEHTREVLYSVKEGRTIDFSLLFGWGSYEMLRGGFETRLNNLWGLAHEARLKAVQSFKASSGDFLYNVPDAVGHDVDLFVHSSGLHREEISFTREEYGGGIGAHRFFRPAALDANVRYDYQILDTLSAVPAVATEGVTNPAVGSIIIDLKYDRRDNPLYPRRGFKLFLTSESATDRLGGDVNYERVDVQSSWHHRVGTGRWLSLGLSHGAAVSFGDPAHNLPFNKRYFPGGDNSIRGYQEGEASPRNALHQYVGAETYSLGTVELEQALTPKWSAVFFSDSLGEAHRLANYPFDTGLFSVGVGVRWRTIIGPVRLEYGHNLNPRSGDPSGTLLFSLGFPF